MILLVLVALFSTQLLIFTIFVFETDENDIVSKNLQGEHFQLKMKAALNIIEHSSEQHLYAMNTYRVEFSVGNKPLYDVTHMSATDKVRSIQLQQQFNDQQPSATMRQFKPIENRLYAAMVYLKDQLSGTLTAELKNDPRNILMQSQIRLSDGKWLGMTVFDLHNFPIWIRSTVKPMAIFTFIFIIFAVFVVKRLTSPLAELADNAHKFGKGHAIAPLEPRGPEDMQNAIVAFNTMHKRLLSVNDHRARALAAISHDIRTPLTSMRLNAEYITDADVQHNILEKIEEMEQICEATVTFALKDSWSEKNKHFDLTSLIESLCCDLNAQELDVSFDAQHKIPFQGRPIALKRAISNLIKNGVDYGHRVNVFIVQSTSTLEIHIEDEGNGIPDSEKERLFEPFERSEQSRNRSSGGMGLGMAIARSVVRSHGGEIELNNRPIKGLDAVIILPL